MARRSSSSMAYVTAVAATVAAVLLRWLLDPWMGDHLPFVTLFAAVAVAVWYGGYRPALAVIVLGLIACSYLFIEPRGALGTEPHHFIGAILFLFTCAVIVGFGEAMLRAWQRVAESSELLRVTFSSIGEAIITTDTECRITDLNCAAESLTDSTLDEARGQPLDAILSVDSGRNQALGECPIHRAAREGVAIGGEECRLIRRDGSAVWVLLHAAPLTENGIVRGAVAAIVDISGRKQAEDALHVAQAELSRKLARMSRLQELSTRLVQADNLQELLQEILAASTELTGTDKGNIQFLRPETGKLRIVVHQGLGQRLLEHFAEEGWSASCEAALHTAQRVIVEDVTREPSVQGTVGLEVVLEDGIRAIQCTPLISRGGEFLGMLNNHFRQVHRPSDADLRYLDLLARMAADLIERTRAAEALRASEQRLAAELSAISRLHAVSTRLISTADLSVALKDVLANAIETCGADFGNVQLFNSQSNALEIVAQQGFQQGFLEHFNTVRVDDESACARAMHRGERISIDDVILDPTFGPHLDIAASTGFRAVTSTPLKGHAGVVEGMLSVHFRSPHQLSERDQRLLDLYARHAADLVEHHRCMQALRDADRQKDEFLAMLAHELRNPLAPMRNAVQILQMKGALRPELQGTLEIIDRQMGQLSRLVDDLMDISRITSGKIELRPERVLLRKIIEGAVETSRPLIEQCRHQLTVTLPPQEVWLNADTVRLGQVFSNLLNNAAKYTEPGGRIDLSAKVDGSDVIVSVQDTGIGIPRDKLHSVFGLFQQVDGTRERSRGGLGIGLSLVEKLLQLHAGRIEARSEGLGKGSVFEVRLPVFMEAVAGSIHVPEEPEVPESSLRILVVDDNRDAADTLGMMLRATGNETEVAYEGEQALRAADDFRPDVILLDIGLPKLNGYAVCRRIREQSWGKRIFLIAVTGWGQEDDKRLAEEAGFDQHMVKPVAPKVLGELLRKLRPSRLDPHVSVSARPRKPHSPVSR